mmetsp:Transcript_42094/g.131815  ORF Transcript_42094/g.131815 Transcript_42094/m.131815 type:complete len:90 (+) Transcript_42094:76-345(+)
MAAEPAAGGGAAAAGAAEEDVLEKLHDGIDALALAMFEAVRQLPDPDVQMVPAQLDGALQSLAEAVSGGHAHTPARSTGHIGPHLFCPL